MSFNLIEAAKNLFTTELVSNIANHFGESESSIVKALSAVIPTTVSGLADKATTADGVNAIIKLAQDYHQTGILNNPASFLNTNATDLLSKGTNLVSNLFGSTKASQLSNLISGFSGVSQSTSSGLFGIALPSILALLGKHASNSSVGTTAITTALSSQFLHISSAIPAGFSLGSIFGNINTKTSSAASVNKYVEESKENSGGSMRILLPLLLLAFVAFLAWYFFKDGCNKNETVATATNDSLHIAKDSSSLATVILGKVDSLTGDFIYNEGDTVTIDLPNGEKLTIGKNSTEYKLITFLLDKNAMLDTVKGNWFEFTNVHFKSGTATLTDGSSQQLKNMAVIFKAFPTAQFKLGGYTDSTGDAALNETLSQKRADLVAETIKKLGAPKSSIVDAKGYGKEWPIADNATVEGRAMNRRVAVNVKAK